MKNAEQMQLNDYLSVPYLLEARLVELSPDVWVSHVSYPELPDCSAAAPRLETALAQLEKQRILTIVRMLDAGQNPPIPRPPLASTDPVWIAEQSDVPADIVARIRTISPA
jgi:hypothetical protein